MFISPIAMQEKQSRMAQHLHGVRDSSSFYLLCLSKCSPLPTSATWLVTIVHFRWKEEVKGKGTRSQHLPFSSPAIYKNQWCSGSGSYLCLLVSFISQQELNMHISFPTLCSGTSCQQFEIGHSGSVYTMEIGKPRMSQFP